MVSLRRRRLLGYPSDVPLPDIYDQGFSMVNAYPRPMDEAEKPMEIDQGKYLSEEFESPPVSACSQTNNQSNQPKFSHPDVSEEQITPPVAEKEVKHRKQHRRKRVHEQEDGIMRGVYYRHRKWQAAIKVDKKQVHLGTVNSQKEAAHLYDRAAFVCGRDTNFELPEEEKEELKKLSWEGFLATTRDAKSNKRAKRLDFTEATPSSVQNSNSEGGEQGAEDLFASDKPDSSSS